MWRMKRAMKITKMCLMKDQIKFFLIDIKCLRCASAWKTPSVEFVSVSWIVTLLLFYAYKEVSKGEDDELICNTNNEDMCILVWLLWYSYYCIVSVTYILCFFCLIIEITPQRKMKIISHLITHKVCQPPPAKKMKESLGKEKMTNPIAILMIKICVQLFNYYFVSCESWTVSLQFWWSSMFIYFRCASVVVPFCFC